MSAIHTMELPRRVVVGKGVLGNVSDACKGMGTFKKVLILTDPIVYDVAAKTVIDSLNDEGFDVAHLIMKEVAANSIKEAGKKVQEVRPEVIIGVGGGKVIDVSKLTAAEKTIPFISVPTAASHDGVSSPQASIGGVKGPVSFKAQAPLAIIADIDVIAQAPFRLTASGCGDIISKFTAVRDWWLSHHLRNEYYGDYAANLALMSAKLLSRNSEIIHEGSSEGIRIVVEALISCGVAMSIAGSSRPCSGSEHLFSHALDLIAPGQALHGEQCGVGTIMMAYLHKIDWKKIRRVLKNIGAPTTAEELNITSEDVAKALTKAHRVRPDRYTILGEKGLSKEAAVKLAKSTGVIP